MLRSCPGPRRGSSRQSGIGRHACLWLRAPWIRLFVMFVTVVCAFSCAISQSSTSGCTTAAQGALPRGTYTANRVVTLSVDCGPGGFASVDWGDQTGFVSGPSPLTANHTYPAGASIQPPYGVVINGAALPNLYVTFPTAVGPFSAFSGQASTVTSPMTAEKALSVIVLCQSVFDSNGNVFTPQQLNITCTSPDLPATIPAFPASLPIRVVVATSGIARLQKPHDSRSVILFVCMVVPLLGIASRARRKSVKQMRITLAACSLVLLALTSISCGGGFTSPQLGSITPSGQYQVVVVTEQNPANSTPDPTFVQTTLIVPLTVTPTQ